MKPQNHFSFPNHENLNPHSYGIPYSVIEYMVYPITVTVLLGMTVFRVY